MHYTIQTSVEFGEIGKGTWHAFAPHTKILRSKGGQARRAGGHEMHVTFFGAASGVARERA